MLCLVQDFKLVKDVFLQRAERTTDEDGKPVILVSVSQMASLMLEVRTNINIALNGQSTMFTLAEVAAAREAMFRESDTKFVED